MKHLAYVVALSVVVSATDSAVNDADVAKQACRFYGLDYRDKNWRKLMLPKLKLEFLPYRHAYPIGYRQHWEPIVSNADLVDQIRRNGCPLAWTRKQSLAWIHEYYRQLNNIRHRR